MKKQNKQPPQKTASAKTTKPTTTEANDFEYYVIDRKGDQAYPLVSTNPASAHTRLYIGDNFSEYHGKPIPDPKPMQFIFSAPIPKKPVIGDYFAQPESIVSKKMADAMAAMKIKGIQLIPATVESDKGDIYDDFFYVYIHHYIDAMDKEKSDFEYEYEIYYIDSFVLDEKALSKIPLEKRLVFKLKEKKTLKLFHRSVVDAIMATNPDGVMFTKVENWQL